MSFDKLLMEVVLGGAGVGAIVSYLWATLERVWLWAAALDVTAKRVAIAVLCFLVVQPFYWLAIWMTLLEAPISAQAWLSATVSYAAVAFTGGTLWHAASDKVRNPVAAYWPEEIAK
jgi:hypothetical protein